MRRLSRFDRAVILSRFDRLTARLLNPLGLAVDERVLKVFWTSNKVNRFGSSVVWKMYLYQDEEIKKKQKKNIFF